VITLAESTADQHLSLGGVITGLAQGDIRKALDYTKVVNTEDRRNAVLADVIDVLLHRPTSEIDPAQLEQVLDSITDTDSGDEARLSIMERFAEAQTIEAKQVKGLLPLIASLEHVSSSVVACRALVYAIKILHRADEWGGAQFAPGSSFAQVNQPMGAYRRWVVAN
jgi:hypothetical protein